MVALVGWAVPTKRQNTFESLIPDGYIAISGVLGKTVVRGPLMISIDWWAQPTLRFEPTVVMKRK